MRPGIAWISWTYSVFAIALMAGGEAWALGEAQQPWGGGAQSMDRPNAYPPPLPDYAPSRKPEGFTLPEVPPGPGELPEGGGKLDIQRIVFTGNTVFSDEALHALVKTYEGRAVSIAELEALRQQLTRYYIDHGYINSGAVIPQDGYKGGTLRIELVEGRLDEVRVHGQERLREGYIENRLRGDPGEPLKLEELQDRFQLLLSDPLISRMNGRIVPGAKPGYGILDVEVTRARAYHLSLFGNNYRPPSIGSEAFGVTGSVSNLSGFGDTLDFTYIHSSGSNRYTGGFSLPVTDYGTTAFFRFDEGDSQVVEAPTNKLNIKSQVHNLEGGFSHPLINTLRRRLNLGLMLAVRENDTTLLGQPFSFVPGVTGGTNQATVWRIYQDYLQRWDRHALAARSTFSVGMEAFGATPYKSSQYPSSDFFAWLGQFQYAYRVDETGGQVIFRGNGQFSNAPLLPLEKIAVGGVGTVRGYRENYRVRDEGYSFALEYRQPVLPLGMGQTLSLIPFIDYGNAWDHATPYNRNADNSALFSIGMGLEWQFKPLTAEIYYGYAVITPQPRTSGDLQDDGVHFQARLDVF